MKYSYHSHWLPEPDVEIIITLLGTQSSEPNPTGNYEMHFSDLNHADTGYGCKMSEKKTSHVQSKQVLSNSQKKWARRTIYLLVPLKPGGVYKEKG